MHSLWKELLKKVNIVETEVDPLLEQSVFTEVRSLSLCLVSAYFSAFAVQDATLTPQYKEELTSDEFKRYAIRLWICTTQIAQKVRKKKWRKVYKMPWRYGCHRRRG